MDVVFKISLLLLCPALLLGSDQHESLQEEKQLLSPFPRPSAEATQDQPEIGRSHIFLLFQEDGYVVILNIKEIKLKPVLFQDPGATISLFWSDHDHDHPLHNHHVLVLQLRHHGHLLKEEKKHR